MKENTIRREKNIVILGILGVVVLLLVDYKASTLIQSTDFTKLLSWWGMLFVMGISFYPLAATLFRKFTDKGYIFSKVLGLVISGWLVWVLSSVHILKFTRVSCICIVAVCAIANYIILYLYTRKSKIKVSDCLGINYKDAMISRAIWYEALFFAFLAFFVYLKCFHPEAHGEEKFMDFGFMKSLNKSDYMPPEDFWFSGTYLNYYYLSQYLATFMSKVSNVGVEYGYNLSLMTIASLCFVLVYSLVSNIFHIYMDGRESSSNMAKQVCSRVAGIISAVVVTFSSSTHYFIYGKLIPVFRTMLGLEGDYSYWYPDATRYIGFQPGDEGGHVVTETPSYSFVQGDLHAHVFNIIMVLTLLAVLFSWYVNKNIESEDNKNGKLKTIIKRELLQPHIIMMSFLIGFFQMSNYWDFPIYFVVCGAVILVANGIRFQFSRNTLIVTALQAVEFLAIAYVTSLLFTLRFDIMASGIKFTDKHSAFYEMMVTWAFPFTCVIVYIITLIKEEIERKIERKTDEKNELKNTDKVNPFVIFFNWLENRNAADLFVIILGLCAMGLVIVPEIVYVVDIYGDLDKRFNTAFKLTYQAFILFGIVIGVLVTRFTLLGKRTRQRVFGIIALVIIIQNAGYFAKASSSWYGDKLDSSRYKTLDASAFLDTELPMDSRAIDWINENIEGRPVILEAAGLSYTDYNRVSVFTGCPTVIGWHTHEWLWKDNVDIVNARGDDVYTIYTCNDVNIARELLAKYDVSYIYVGHLEQEKYQVNYDFLRSLGQVVYDHDEDFEQQTFIVKVDL